MSNEVVDTSTMMTEDQVLAYVQNKQVAIVAELTKDRAVPDDSGMRNALLGTLDSLARNALGSKRIKADEKAAQGMAGMAGIVGEFLNQVGKIRGKENGTIIEDATRTVPTLGSDIPEPVLVPGETDVNPRQTTYEELMSGTD